MLGAALGVLMRRYQVSVEDGLSALVEAGQRSGRTLLVVAAEVIRTCELDGYPP